MKPVWAAKLNEWTAAISFTNPIKLAWKTKQKLTLSILALRFYNNTTCVLRTHRFGRAASACASSSASSSPPWWWWRRWRNRRWWSSPFRRVSQESSRCSTSSRGFPFLPAALRRRRAFLKSRVEWRFLLRSTTSKSKTKVIDNGRLSIT